jgi:hypothetical protein
MAAAAAAVNRSARREQGIVFLFAHHTRQDINEARPAGAAVILDGRCANWKLTRATDKDAPAVHLKQRAGTGPLGVRLAQHCMLRWREHSSTQHPSG